MIERLQINLPSLRGAERRSNLLLRSKKEADCFAMLTMTIIFVIVINTNRHYEGGTTEVICYLGVRKTQIASLCSQ